MNGIDLRGFDYALEPARQRALHRVEAAIAQLGRQQRELSRTREHAAACRQRCQDLALRFTPAHQAVIDPRQAALASQQLRHLHQVLAESEQAVSSQEALVQQARTALEQARTEQEAFETHRVEAVHAHAMEAGRRQQAAADQDWMARQHAVSVSATPGKRQP
jgi:flagellar biosynthesis chaperone FliJ